MSTVKHKQERKLKDERRQAKKETLPAKEERKIKRYENSSNHLTLDKSVDDDKPSCSVPMLISCCRKGEPMSSDGVKMLCTNKACEFTKKLVHPECFESLEGALLKILKTMGSARGWTDVQRRQNLWEKKGLNLIHKQIRCQCTGGLMHVDNDFKNAQKVKKSDESGTPQTEKRKPKKKNKDLPILTFGKITATRDELIPMNRKKIHEIENHFMSTLSQDESIDDYSEEISLRPALPIKRISPPLFNSTASYGKPPESIWSKRVIVQSENATPIRPAIRKSRMESFGIENQQPVVLQRNRGTSMERMKASPLQGNADSAFESPGTEFSLSRETSPNNEMPNVAKTFTNQVLAVLAEDQLNTSLLDDLAVSTNNESLGSITSSLNVLDSPEPLLLNSTLSPLSNSKPRSLDKSSPFESTKKMRQDTLERQPPGLLDDQSPTASSNKLQLNSFQDYTLFGQHSPSFLIGERLMGYSKLPFQKNLLVE